MGKKGFITLGRKEIRYTEEILNSVTLFQEVVVVHCTGHQKTGTEVAKGSCLADEATKYAARTTEHEVMVLPLAHTWISLFLDTL